MANYVDLASLHDPVPRAKPPASWGAQIRENDEFFYANRRQICTSSTRPTGFEGLEIYETDTDLVWIFSGSAWVRLISNTADETWTPTFTQAATITKTVANAQYQRRGRHYSGFVSISATSAGTAGSTILVGCPTGATAAYSTAACGHGWYYNGSVNLPVGVYLSTTTAFAFYPQFTAWASALGTVAVFYPTAAGTNTSFTPTVASGHSLVFWFEFTATV